MIIIQNCPLMMKKGRKRLLNFIPYVLILVGKAQACIDT